MPPLRSAISIGSTSRITTHDLTHLLAGNTLPAIPGMSSQEVLNKIRNDKQNQAPRLQPPFPAAVEDEVHEEVSIAEPNDRLTDRRR